MALASQKARLLTLFQEDLDPAQTERLLHHYERQAYIDGFHDVVQIINRLVNLYGDKIDTKILINALMSRLQELEEAEK